MAEIQHFEEQAHFPPGYKWSVTIILMLGMVMAMLDSSIVNVSIPKIMADFGVNIDDIEWTLTGYMLAFATLMPLTGWLRGRIGYKRIYIAALFLFTLGSLLCGMAVNLPTLIAARVIQAIGGGAMQPTAMAMMTEVFPPKERGTAMGMFGIAIIFGPALGPTLGGYLTDAFGWRSIFLVNIPIGIITILLATEMLVKDAPHKITKKPFDYWGFIFLAIFLVGFLLGLSKGQREGWTSSYILTCFILSILGFIGFLLVEFHIDHPVVDLRIFKIPVFSLSITIMVARSIGLFGSTFLLPLFVQQQVGYTALQSGLLMLPPSLFMATLMPLGGRLADKVGPKWPTIIGLAIVAYSLFMFRRIDIYTSTWGFILPLMVRSIGMALLMAPITTAALNSVPFNKISDASTTQNIIMQVGASIGIAFFGTILQNRATFHIAMVGQGAKASNPIFGATLQSLMFHIHNLGYSYSHTVAAAQIWLVKNMITSAMVLSYRDVFLIGSIIVALSITAAFFLPLKNIHREHGKKSEPVIVE